MLTEDVLVIETGAGLESVTLPVALAKLCDGSLTGFDGLAAHQRHAWELFLYQTAAMALVRAGEAAAAEDDAAWRDLADAAAWRRRLEALTPGCADTAWSLVVDDATRPAFMQPPIRGGLDRYAVIGRTPDEIDLLVTAKAHDLKPARAADGEPRHWLYALVSLQTQQGYSGRGNFGIARMNGGFGSRPMLQLTPARDLAARFRRGVQAALDARRGALDTDGGLFDEKGRALLWLDPWDAETSISPDDLDPLFVEICRRVRLRRTDQTIEALGRPSEVPRVAAPKELKGDLGDAWTPIAKDGAALTVGAGGFDYRRLHSVIATEDFALPRALETRPDDPPELWLRATALVRGQGKTEGFHERWLLVPRSMRERIAGRQTGAGLIGQRMIADVDAAKIALRTALRTFLQGGPDKLDFKDERPRPFLDQFEQRIDERFFDHLFARLKADDDEATEAVWRGELVRITRALFATAIARLSPPESRRERARATADNVFGAMLRKAGLTVAPATDSQGEDP